VKPGDIVLVDLPHIDASSAKLRPVLVLSVMPGRFGDRLVCGVSSQISECEPDWDEMISRADPDFGNSGLRAPSVLRLSWLAVVASRRIRGRIGSLSQQRLRRVCERLSAHLAS